MGKGLAERTMKDYLSLYRSFEKGLEEEDLTQSYINRFLITHTSNKTRSFVNNLFTFLNITHLNVPKFTGRKPKRKHRSISPQEIKVLRAWIYSNKHIKYLICLDLSFLCALRKAEVLVIKINDFDIKEWAGDQTTHCRLLIHGKGQRERFVPVNPSMMKRIINFIAEKNLSMDDNLFNFKRNSWQNVFFDAVKETMDHHYTLHDLRRSRATKWLREGVDLSRVKNRLGHSSVSTTQLYINLDEEKEFDAWAKEY